MQDSQIIELLFRRDERALEVLDKKYGAVCYSVAQNMLGNAADAEECVNDSYLGVWNSIPPNKPEKLLAYVCRIVRNLAAKKYHSNTAQKRNSFYDVALDEFSECLASTDLYENEIDARLIGEYINVFLSELDKTCRVIFVLRYWFSYSPEDIANKVGKSKNYVAVKLTRTRKRLREYLKQRGIDV